MESCVHIIDKFPSDLAAPIAGDLALKSMFCNFIIASALVALARTQDHIEQQLEDYRVMRKHIAAFDSELQPQLESLDEKSAKDLINKLATLLVFDFEGTAALEQWTELAEIVRKAAICKSITTFQVMGDCLLRSQVPAEGLK
jgi:hypothetical protein